MEESLTLKQMTLAVLKQSGEQMSYRDLSTVIWSTFPAHHAHLMRLYEDDERKARREHRIRLGLLVKQYPNLFSATMSDGIVLVGLAATPTDTLVAEEADEEEDIAEAEGAKPSVYWYTFPAYQSNVGSYPIKIGRGNNPDARINHQVTAMPEAPVILGKYEHPDTSNLERALHAVLSLRGKRKLDAPGTEWFVTTHKEITELIDFILTAAGKPST